MGPHALNAQWKYFITARKLLNSKGIIGKKKYSICNV
jgi:hypothetical protein